ncbi:MAG TPA: arginine--tRNA ligase [Bacteroidia bacterium]|nr:arginine--tRNA ligase [Bacteroidia bacterium]HRS58722.1 arginine--tRNA ligase [Bacteroidia bacterium]
MNINQILKQTVQDAFLSVYQAKIETAMVQVEETDPGFEGDLTIVLFNLLKFSRKKPEQTAGEVAAYLTQNLDFIERFNIVKGFLNLVIKDSFWLNHLKEIQKEQHIPIEKTSLPQKYLIEYSSPNTNKPLHLGHIRNNLLGQSLSEFLKLRGHQVVKVNLVNDRGIHICKSMLAWMKDETHPTPESLRIKGDHLVGNYYVKFDKMLKAEIEQAISLGISREDAENLSSVMKEARQLLIRWEKNDPEVRKIWEMMNDWVYAGFDETYRRLGISFDKIYYESDTYLLGKAIVDEGLEKGIFYRKDDNSVWVDLSADGFDEKLLLRADGTSVYITQDLGTAELRYHDFQPDVMVYVVGNEQEYHFNVLKTVMKKLGRPYAESIFHLSYGMVDLPEGKMKSREGTVVDADDLMDKMQETALQYMAESGKSAEIDQEEQKILSEMVGMGALKFFILKTDSKKRILFDPKESIDFQGFTGPFIQYTHARIQSVFRKGSIQKPFDFQYNLNVRISDEEKEILKKIYFLGQSLAVAEQRLDTSVIALYIYQLAKLYNKFYHDYPILNETDEDKKAFRIVMSWAVSLVLRKLSGILGIEMPEKM